MPASPQPVYRFGPFRLHCGERLLYRGDQPVPLTPRAIDTLIVLVERHGRLVTKDEILREVWHDAFVEENNLAQQISMLRRVLALGGDATFIETVPKRGYRFAVPVIEGADAPAASPIASEAPSVEAVPGPRGRSWHWAVAPASVLMVAWFAWFAWGLRGGAANPVATPDERPSVDSGLTRIAVLPFANLGRSGEDYFAAGMTEEVTSRLAGLSTLGVVSSTSSREYDRHGKTITRIASDLGASYIVEGSVQWRDGDGGRLRVIPRLIRAADDTTVWTHQYDAVPADLFPVQADIAQQISSVLHGTMSAADRRTMSTRPTADGDAYLAYLRGMTAFQQSQSDTGLQAKARRELETAVARDPKFALAWSWLANVYATQYNAGAERSPATRSRAFDAARLAIELSPDLPEAHAAHARVLMILDRDYDGALRELEIARASQPNSPELLRLGAFLQQRRGRLAASLALHMRAFDLDPSAFADLVAIHYLLMRQYDESRRFIDVSNSANRVAAFVPDAWGLFSQGGDVQAARTVLERALLTRSPADARVRGLLSRLEWFDGRHARALELVGQMDAAGAWWPANFRFPAAIAAGQVYESLGERQRADRHYASALAQLERRARDTPDDYQVEAAMGLAAAGLRQADVAVRHAARAVELLPVTTDATEGPVYVYVLALAQARVGRHADAFATLDRLFAVPGFYNEHWVRRDPWFASLRGQPEFAGRFERWAQQKGDVLLAAR